MPPSPRPLLRSLALGSVVLAAAAAEEPAQVRVDTSPSHVLNTVNPDTATGAWMDVLSRKQIDHLSEPATIAGIRNLGWGSITMRNNSELRLAAWHWNEHGQWSDPSARQGYYTGSAALGDPIHYGYSYSLPHRDFMTSGDPPLIAGFQSYWKSNPYLTRPFTGESDALHPQWIVIDMGKTRDVDAIHIQWVDPYATVYVVQHWIGDKNALDWDLGPNGVWRAFPSGIVTSGAGGDVHLRLADAPIQARFVRVLMTQSSNTPDSHGAGDIRNCVGYALQTLSVGTMDPQGRYSLVYPPGGIEPGPGGGRGEDESAAGNEAFPGSAEDTAGSFCASSIDPWHEAGNRIEGGQEMYNGMDNFFTSGLTMGHPALVPVTVIYGTPEDAANEVAYIYKRHYPVVGIEMGEECDGKHTMPEDYGALYCQWAAAIHRLTPQARLGGPVFEGVDKDITLWADDEGRTSWMRRFVDYLRSHGRLADLGFMSFEHYPFLVNGASPPCEWETLYEEPGIMKHVVHMWREDGVPANVPLIVSESGITAGAGHKGYLGVTGNAIWECDAIATFFSQGGSAFYRPRDQQRRQWTALPRPAGRRRVWRARLHAVHLRPSYQLRMAPAWRPERDLSGRLRSEGRRRPHRDHRLRRPPPRRLLVGDADQSRPPLRPSGDPGLETRRPHRRGPIRQQPGRESEYHRLLPRQSAEPAGRFDHGDPRRVKSPWRPLEGEAGPIIVFPLRGTVISARSSARRSWPPRLNLAKARQLFAQAEKGECEA